MVDLNLRAQGPVGQVFAKKTKKRSIRFGALRGVIVATVWALGALPATNAAYCTSCSNQVSTAFLSKVVEPAVLNLFYNTPSITLDKTLGGAVRMAFHDVGAFDAAKQTGRANGCFLMDDAGNDGLSPVAIALSELFAKIPQRAGFSRADLFQYAALLAIKQSHDATLAQIPNLPALPPMLNKFRFGRIDAPDCGSNGFITGDNNTVNVERNLLPAPVGDFNHIFGVFVTRMTMSLEDMVALSGAHTLGSATTTGSGFDGQWVTTNKLLDNSYYVNILERPWQRETAGPAKKPQWGTIGNSDLFMLNTDLGLAYTVRPNAAGCNATLEKIRSTDQLCSENTDGNQKLSREWVEKFAGGPTRNITAGLEAWYGSFIPAMLKLGEMGYTDADLFEPCVLPPVCTADSGGTQNVTGEKIDLTILFDDEYRASYHGTSEFKTLLREKVATALDLTQNAVSVLNVRSGSVIASLRLILNRSSNTLTLRMLQSDSMVLQLLTTTFQSEIQSGLVGSLKLVRVSGLNLADSTSSQIDEALIGPFQSSSINKQATLIGCSVSAVSIVLIASFISCCVTESSAEDIEKQEEAARKQRKINRLSSLAPRAFSSKAVELSYAPEYLDFSEAEGEDGGSNRRKRRSGERRRHRRERSRSRNRGKSHRDV